MIVRILALLFTTGLLCGPASAQVERDTLEVETLGDPGPHWFWAHDVAFFNMADGRTYLYNADTGSMLGMLSTGIFYTKFETPDDYSMIYSPETYYSRHTRGERTDVVTFYDPNTLSVVDEVEIPSKRHSGLVNIGFNALTDNERFLAIYNFNPAQSVSIVDVKERRFAGEIETPGCAMTYAAGPRQIMMMCGNGSLMTLDLDASGNEASRSRSEPFFNPIEDPVLEKPVRIGDTWYFVSFQGMIHEVDVSGDEPSFSDPWPLKERDETGWRPGGFQLMGVHAGLNRLAVLMHEGGEDTHKYPGTELWIYDLDERQRIRRMELVAPVMTINITQDDEPLLIASHGEPVIDIYDFESGEHLRTIGGVGQTPLYIHVP